MAAAKLITRCLVALAALGVFAVAAQAQNAGRVFFDTNCASCHSIPPVLSVPHTGGVANFDLTASWVGNESTFRSRLSALSGAAPAMASLGTLDVPPSTTNADNRNIVLTYLRAVRDGVRSVTSAPSFPTTALSRSSTSNFQVTITNYRRDDMSYTVGLQTGTEFVMLSGGGAGTCTAATNGTGVPTNCVVNGSIRFTPSGFNPTPRTDSIVVSSSWTSAPGAPSGASMSFGIAADAVDAFVASAASLSFTTSAGSPTDSNSLDITDNVGEELRACLTNGDAPFNGIANYSVSGAGTVAGQCITFPAVGGITPQNSRSLTVNILFSPGATATPLNARLNLQRFVGAATSGNFKEVALAGNNGPVIQLDAQRLFTSVPIEVDGTPASADRPLKISSRGSSALSFTASPPAFRIAAGTFSGGSCQPIAAAPAAAIADYSVVAGGCAALNQLAAFNGTPSSANECTLTVRFDATAVGPRCGVLTIHTNTATQTVVLEGSGFLGPRPVVVEGSTQQTTGVLLDFTTQRLTGVVYPARTLALRNGGTTGDLEVVLPAIDAVPGFSIARTGTCSAIGPFDAGSSGPQCDIAVSFLPTELRSYAGSFDIQTRPAGSSAAYSVFRVNLAGIGSNTAPALRWEDGSGNEVTSLAFAKEAGVACTTTCERSVVLHNLGPGSARIDLVNAIGLDSASWTARLNGCNAGQFIPEITGSCGVIVTFNPATAGNKTATLRAASTGNGPPTLTLSGTSSAGSLAPQLAVSQASPFAATRAGSRSGPVQFTIANSGNFPLQVLGWTVSGPFSVISTSCPGFPFVLEGGSGCTAMLTFDATAAGAASGAFEVRADAASTTVPLSGTGESAADVSSGGCSIASGTTLADPTLWALAVLAAAVLALRWRRRSRGADMVRRERRDGRPRWW